jgi:hypothetical protein
MRLVGRLILSSLLIALCVSPASAGPMKFSATDVCVLMGAGSVGTNSRVVGYPACAGGAATGLASGVVALPIAGLAGGVASFWGSGIDVFESVWGKGAFTGFVIGAFLTGYPVNLAKTALWDVPQNIRCSLTQHCEAIRPDPGVDYPDQEEGRALEPSLRGLSPEPA